MAENTDSSPTPPVTDEQLRWFENAQARAVRTAVRRVTRRTLAAFVAVVLTGGLASALSTGASFDKVEQGQLTSCQRLNTVRAQSNLDSAVIFDVLSVSARRENALVKGDPKNARAHGKSAKLLIDQARRVTVVSLTDCPGAVKDPKRYKPGVPTTLGNPLKDDTAPEVQDILDESDRAVRQNKG